MMNAAPRDHSRHIVIGDVAQPLALQVGACDEPVEIGERLVRTCVMLSDLIEVARRRRVDCYTGRIVGCALGEHLSLLPFGPLYGLRFVEAR